MNIKYLLVLLLVLGLIGGAAYYSYQPLGEAITFGLDIDGGIMVLLEAVPSEQVPTINDDAMVRAVAILSQRVNGLGVAEPEIVREGARRIRVSLPGFDDQQEVLNMIGQTALLEFRDIEGKVFLSGDRLRDAQEQLDEQNRAHVSLTLDEEGGRLMREFTRANIGGRLVITLDGEVVSAPTIEGEVGSEGSITGLGSLAEARNLAIMLRSGALPVELETRDFRGVGPTLGKASLERSVFAGLIGLALVLLFMVAVYRGFGMAANFALAAYTLMVLWSLAAINATITLPGVAGIVLGIGMAVDANVIIFERIKDEVKTGRTLRASIKAGFSRAIWTVMDANITTLIGTGVLYWFGTGPVRGFAVTLSLSIILSMLTAIFVTRLLLTLMLNAKLVASAKALGA
ncbi:MAG: protein translocase subunit SecD [Thermaerobacter sp.]|nr:protein translocase subunit SecD [Thermaerobacter sp.]